MEINMQLSDNCFICFIYINSVSPEHRYTVVFADDKSKVPYGDSEFYVSLSNVLNNIPEVELFPCRSKTDHALLFDLQNKHWPFIQEIILMMESCAFYNSAKALLQKAGDYDKLSNSLTNGSLLKSSKRVQHNHSRKYQTQPIAIQV